MITKLAKNYILRDSFFLHLDTGEVWRYAYGIPSYGKFVVSLARQSTQPSAAQIVLYYGNEVLFEDWTQMSDPKQFRADQWVWLKTGFLDGIACGSFLKCGTPPSI